MDGTLIDSTGIWLEIDKEFFAKRGYNSVPKDYSQTIVHMGLQKGAEMTLEKYGVSEDTVESIIKEWRDASIEKYANEIPLKPYALDFLKLLKNNGVKMAIATANDEELYGPCLDRLAIRNFFDVIVDVNAVKQGKSSPAIFDYALRELKGRKEATIVVEDTLMSLKTAYDAGYITIGVDDKSSKHLEEDKKKYSNKYVYSFKELL